MLYLSALIISFHSNLTFSSRIFMLSIWHLWRYIVLVYKVRFWIGRITCWDVQTGCSSNDHTFSTNHLKFKKQGLSGCFFNKWLVVSGGSRILRLWVLDTVRGGPTVVQVGSIEPTSSKFFVFYIYKLIVSLLI